MRERLLAAVSARFQSDDPGALFSEDALRELDQLMGFLAIPGDLDAQVAYVVGLAHLARGDFGTHGEQDQQIAATVLFPLLLSNPEALPEQIRLRLEPAWEALERAGDTRAQAMGRALTDVVWLLRQRLNRLGEEDRDGLVAGVAALAVSLLPAGHDARPAALCAQGYALLNAGSDELLDQAVTVFREAFEAISPNDPHYAGCAHGLAAALAGKAEQVGDRSSMAEAAALFRIAANPESGGHPALVQEAEQGARYAEAAARPGGMLAAMHQVLDQLDEMVRRDRERLAELDRAGGEVPPELGRGLAELDEQARRIREVVADVERDLRRSRQTDRTARGEARSGEALMAAFEELAGGNARYADAMRTEPAFLHDLAFVAQSAFQALDDVADQFWFGPGSGGERSPMLTLENPASGPRRDRADLDEILALHERVFRELPPDAQQLGALRISHLALSRDRLTGRTDPESTVQERELREQLPTLLQAAASGLERQFSSAGQVQSHAAMGTAGMSPFETVAEVDDAITRNRLRLAAMAPDDPDRHSAQSSLAYALFSRYMITGDERAFHEAVAEARQAVTAETIPDPQLVLVWGMTVHLRELGGHEPVTEHPPVDPPVPSDRVTTLRIAHGDAEAALASWEAGRAFLLASALITRHELDRLRAAEPALADRFVALRARMSVDSPFDRDAEAVRRYEALTHEWNALLEQIRARRGFDRFLLRPLLTFAELAPAAAEGPVIAVNLDPARCDAFVLRDGAVAVVRLPGLRVDELAEQAGAFRDAIAALHDPSAGPDRLVRGAAGRVVVDTLAWLWDVLAAPVLEAAGLAAHPGGDAPWPRVWWAPAGPLTFLPLHAAGRHGSPGESVLDRAISSYTPTLRALVHSRARHAPTGDRIALAVAVPETPGHPALPATTREAASFAAAFTSSGAAPEVLVGPAATADAVRAALPRAAFVHFACHASSDPSRAEASHLLLHDGPLSVTELSRTPLQGAQLAYLSACATARGSAALADDAVHLASAVQLAGFPQVIGTLWEIGDDDAARTAEQVHKELARTTDGAGRPAAAHALHVVTRRMRAERPGSPWTWAAHLHTGA